MISTTYGEDLQRISVNLKNMHFVLDREYLNELPDSSYLEKYRKLLLELPVERIDIISQHLTDAHLEFYCKCGCHSFLVYPRIGKELPLLQEKKWGNMEIAYQTNYNKELNVMLLFDSSGILSEVTVFFEPGNTRVIPEDLAITGIEQIW